MNNISLVWAQSFPQVLRTWGALQNLMEGGEGEGEGFESIHVRNIGGEGVKTEVKNTCEGVHLLVKLKSELLHTNFSMIL